MSAQVVVLGAGYAGAAAIPQLESQLPTSDITWISDRDYHLVLHESHRVIRDPSVQEKITIPVEDIKSPRTDFIQGTVVGVDADERTVELDDGQTVEYEYLVVALGSQTPFYGIPGLESYGHTLKSLDDALGIHEAVKDAAKNASRNDPAQVLIGGAGLSGIQSAGEVAEFRDHHQAPIEITLLEALDEIMPGQDPDLQSTVRRMLQERDIDIKVDNPITEVTEEQVHLDEGEPLDYDVVVWTGGVTGRDCMAGSGLEANHNRLTVESTFETSDERVFAIGDCALIEQGDEIAPPTAQAAWQAGDVVAKNVANRMSGAPLETWTYDDKGTLISIGEKSVAHGIDVLPITTFNAYPATFLKKFVAARWIADITSWPRALSAWDSL